MIDVRHLSHTFGHRWALRNVSFSLSKGEFLFLTGPSGAGKSTLLRILHGALPFARGRVVVAGFDLGRLRRGDVPLLRREVAVVFQDFKVLPEQTAFENVGVALEVRGTPRALLSRRVRAVLRVLDLDEKAYIPCRELSGGEQQRVAIARAMVVNPKLLLADEPTGNLDRELAFRLMDVFRLFNTHGTTVVMATHNQELVDRFSGARVLRLVDGAVDWASWPGGRGLGDDPDESRPEAQA